MFSNHLVFDDFFVVLWNFPGGEIRWRQLIQAKSIYPNTTLRFTPLPLTQLLNFYFYHFCICHENFRVPPYFNASHSIGSGTEEFIR